jgi:putative ABC transport system permease protein
MDEIEGYMAEEAAENRARGMSEEEAKRQARIKFGGPIVVRESLWRQNAVPLLDSLVRDSRSAARTLLRTPASRWLQLE